MSELGPLEDPRYKKRRLDWDVRGVIAILLVLGTFSYAGVQLLVTGNPSTDIPLWMPTLTGTVIAFYFGGRMNGGSK